MIKMRASAKPVLGDGLWLYMVKRYLCLAQLRSSNVGSSDHSPTAFASPYVEGKAEKWVLNVLSLIETSHSWNDFKAAIVKGFMPADHRLRAQNKLRKPKQLGSVERHFAEYRNIVLMVGDNSYRKILYRFINVLKHTVGIERMRSGCSFF